MCKYGKRLYLLSERERGIKTRRAIMETYARLKKNYVEVLAGKARKLIDLPDMRMGRVLFQATSEGSLPLPFPRIAPELALLKGGAKVATSRGHLEYDLSSASQDFALSVENNMPYLQTVTIEVTYPSTRVLTSKEIPLSFFQRKFDELLNRATPAPVTLRVNNNELFVNFSPAIEDLAGMASWKTDLGHLEVSIRFLPDPDVTLRDINSRSLSLVTRVVSGGQAQGSVPEFVGIFDFETEGVDEVEINNFPDVDIKRLKIEVRFRLLPGADHLVVVPEISTDIVADLNHLPSRISSVAGIIQDRIRKKLLESLDASRCDAIGKALTRWLLGGLRPVQSVTADSHAIHIEYGAPEPHELPPPYAERPQRPIDPGNLSKIDHIVVLMMENRSFDHMLGYLSLQGGRADIDGLHGDEANSYRGGSYPSFPLPETRFLESPNHEHECVLNQMQGNMGGFVADFASRHERSGVNPGKVMGHYVASQLPVYDVLAQEFAVCDRWFSSHPGATFPNRFMALTGRLNRDAFGRFEYDNPDLEIFSPIFEKTIFDHLSERNVSWQVYESDYCTLRLFSRYTGDTDRIRPYQGTPDAFLSAAAAGTLPSVSWVDPNFIDFPPGNDDHPPADPRDGQRFVGEVVRALASGPAWSKTLLVITYDEHGGFYDHVPPPPAPDVSGIARYGVRVPAFVISPWVEKGTVSHEIFDHTSVLRSIVRRFCGSRPPDLGDRTNLARDLGSILTRATARTDAPPIPITSSSLRPMSLLRSMPFPTGRNFHGLLQVMRAKYPVPGR
jgi:phospholipase C